MKKILILFILSLGIMLKGNGQEKQQKPINWTLEVKSLGENNYELVAKAKMDKGFHVWALEAGGDGSFINTEIAVAENAKIKWTEAWSTKDKPVVETDKDLYGGTVYFFKNEWTLTRKFKWSDKKVNLNVTVTYQACNDAMCFPPTDEVFTVTN